MTSYAGGCLCGSVRYRLGAEPLTSYVCHCTDCQRRTGSAFALSLIVPAAALVVTRGSTSAYAATLADGRSKRGSCAQPAERASGASLGSIRPFVSCSLAPWTNRRSSLLSHTSGLEARSRG
jgi:hypothetical protein